VFDILRLKTLTSILEIGVDLSSICEPRQKTTDFTLERTFGMPETAVRKEQPEPV